MQNLPQLTPSVRVVQTILRSLIFHLPMDTHETGGWINMRALTGYLLELFEEWSSDDNPNIRIRMFEEIMTHFLRKPPMHTDAEVESRIQHVTISTDGTIRLSRDPCGIDLIMPLPAPAKGCVASA